MVTILVNLYFGIYTRNKDKKVDKLNRKLYWQVEIENDNENQKLIKEEWIWSLIKVVIEGLKIVLIENF